MAMRDSRRPKVSLPKIGLGLLISGVCLYFVLRGVNWGEVWNHLYQVNLGLFLLSMLLMLLAYFLMAWRWELLLDPLDVPGPGGQAVTTKGVRGHTNLLDLYGKMMTGYFFNAFFPARAGDLVRAYLLGRDTGLRKTTVLATIVIEKAFDGLALLLMLLVSLVLLPTVGSPSTRDIAPESLAWLAGIALVVALGGLVVFYRFSDRIAAIAGRVTRKLPLPERIRRLPVRLVETFAGGMHVFKTPGPLISSALISLLVWVVVALMFLAALLSFKQPFPPDVTSVVGLLFLTALVNLGLLVPALPGNVGTYELLVVAGMAFFRVDKDLAVAFALIFHVGQLVVTLVVGLVAFWLQNLSIRQIGPVEEAATQEAEATLETVDLEQGRVYAVEPEE